MDFQDSSTDDEEMQPEISFRSTVVNQTMHGHNQDDVDISSTDDEEMQSDITRSCAPGPSRMATDHDIQKCWFADNVIEICLPLKKISKAQQKEILEKIHLLRNSGGGIICIKNLNFENEQELTVHLDPFHKCMDYIGSQIELGDQRLQDVLCLQPAFNGKYMLVFIEGSSVLHTTKFNTYEKSYSSCNKVTDREKISCFLRQDRKAGKPKSNRLKNRKYIYHENVCDKVGENREIEFKACNTIKSFQNFLKMFELRDHDDKLAKYVSAFAKEQNGGSIIYGISDHGVVEGINIPLDKNQQREVREKILKEVTKNMKWLTRDGKIPTREEVETNFSVTFYDVTNHQDANIKIMEVTVFHFHGIVFTSNEGPIAHRLGINSGEIETVPIEEWHKCVTKGMHMLDLNVRERFRAVRVNPAMPAATEIRQIKDSLYEIQKDVFKREVGLNMVPLAFVQNLCDSNIEMKDVVQCLKQQYANMNSVAVFIEYFLSSINNENTLNTPQSCSLPSLCNTCKYHCDICIFSVNLPIFLTVTNINPSHTECYTECARYCHLAAKMTKLILSSFTSIRFRIRFGIMNINTGNLERQLRDIMKQKDVFPEEIYRFTRTDIAEILKALSLAASLIPASALYSQIGTSYLNVLTRDQLVIMLQKIDKRKKFLIKGFPGSGKTELAKAMLRKLKNQGVRKKEILYLTEHVPISHQIRKLGLCLCLTRTELYNCLEKDGDVLQDFSVKHIIVDDSQFMEEREVEIDGQKVSFDWLEVLTSHWQSINPQHRGLFVIFYGDHRYKSTPPPEFLNGGFEVEELKEIIRNSKEIATHARKFASKNSRYNLAVKKIRHQFTGEKVHVIVRDLSLALDRLRVVDSAIKHCFTKNFHVGEIAVLFKTKALIPEQLFCAESTKFIGQFGTLDCTFFPDKSVFRFQKSGKVPICNALDNDCKDHMVVDTQRRYSSLDRPCVILVDVSVSEYDVWTDKLGLNFVTATRPIAYLVVVKQKILRAKY